MNALDLSKIKNFLRKNIPCVILVVINFMLFVFIHFRQNQTEEMERKIDTTSVKSSLIEKQMGELKNIASDLKNYKNLEAALHKQCFNFGNRTAMYKFLVKLEKILGKNSSNIAISNTYDLTKSKTIALNQDTSEYVGDFLLVDFTVNLQATFSTTITLLKTLREQPYFTNVKKLDFKEHIENTSREDTTDFSKKEPKINATIVFSILGQIGQPGGDNA
ncbi:MAG: hypothetical protein LBJ78_00205 [Puniceicoccales bacterium]|jgi:hypothetical protein|nr:hypothetical protein [Puniceicoccales bacterium]